MPTTPFPKSFSRLQGEKSRVAALKGRTTRSRKKKAVRADSTFFTRIKSPWKQQLLRAGPRRIASDCGHRRRWAPRSIENRCTQRSASRRWEIAFLSARLGSLPGPERQAMNRSARTTLSLNTKQAQVSACHSLGVLLRHVPRPRSAISLVMRRMMRCSRAAVGRQTQSLRESLSAVRATKKSARAVRDV